MHAGDTIDRFINATFAAPTRPNLYKYAAVDRLSSEIADVMNADRLPIVSTKDQRHEAISAAGDGLPTDRTSVTVC